IGSEAGSQQAAPGGDGETYSGDGAPPPRLWDTHRLRLAPMNVVPVRRLAAVRVRFVVGDRYPALLAVGAAEADALQVARVSVEEQAADEARAPLLQVQPVQLLHQGEIAGRVVGDLQCVLVRFPLVRPRLDVGERQEQRREEEQARG